MKFKSQSIFLLTAIIFTLTGCNAIGHKTASISLIYGFTAFISLVLLLGYCYLRRTKNNWYHFLFVCVFIVNLGYFSLSISQNLSEALLANRISYFGSVFLPVTMLLLIMDLSFIRYPRWLPYLFIILGFIVFLIAASPGYSDIYYKEVSLDTINGISVLNKTYGPWHSIYLYYLVGYFLAMLGCVANTIYKKRMDSNIETVMLVIVVFINICVWLIEQIVHLNFEFLSISYIITELFMLGLQLMSEENSKLKILIHEENCRLKTLIHDKELAGNDYDHKLLFSETDTFSLNETDETDGSHPAACQDGAPHRDSVSEHAGTDRLTDAEALFLEGLKLLTPTEKMVYERYLSGSTTKEIMADLNIKENTLKFHNKNIYSKLGVSSRKQLLELSRKLNA